MFVERDITYEARKEVQDGSDLGNLKIKIEECINKAFGQEMPKDEVSKAIKGALVVIAQDGEQVVGFASLKYGKLDDGQRYLVRNRVKRGNLAYSLDAGVVDRNHQGIGIYENLNRYRMQHVIDDKSPVVFTTTQNPKVEKGVVKILNEYIKQGLLIAYETHHYKLLGFYGRRLTNYPIDTKDTPYNELNIAAGDAFIIAFFLKYPNGVNQLKFDNNGFKA